jgi:hypothetical protein
VGAASIVKSLTSHAILIAMLSAALVNLWALARVL